MNCTVCKKPVSEHQEGIETDVCIEEKLGLRSYETERVGILASTVITKGTPMCDIPHYSSPTMSAETWSLVEKFVGLEITWIKTEGVEITWVEMGYDGYRHIKAPTATLAICRAFLANKEKL